MNIHRNPQKTIEEIKSTYKRAFNSFMAILEQDYKFSKRDVLIRTQNYALQGNI